jgi:hypothetical protein
MTNVKHVDLFVFFPEHGISPGSYEVFDRIANAEALPFLELPGNGLGAFQG